MVKAGEVQERDHVNAAAREVERREAAATARAVATEEAAVKMHNIEARLAAALRAAIEAREQLDDQLACVVCMEQPRSVVLRPCNHFVCCSECSGRLDCCPSVGCSTPIKTRLRGISMAPVQQSFQY